MHYMPISIFFLLKKNRDHQITIRQRLQCTIVHWGNVKMSHM